MPGAYKTLKIPFKHIIKENDILPTINDMVTRTSKIVKHIYYFIKLYTIYSFENGKNKVFFDKDKIRYIVSLITSVKSKASTKYVYPAIKNFNNEVFSKLNIKKISRDGLTNVIAYESDIIITCIENNIKNNFVRHFNKYINIVFEEKFKLSALKIDEKKEIWNELKKIKSDILSFDVFTSDKKYHDFIKTHQKYLFDTNKIDTKIHNILYYVKSTPQAYLYTFL